MEPLTGLPNLLIAIPVGLLVLDAIHKWWLFGHARYDAVADTALAALSFTAVHLMTKLLTSEPAPPLHAGVILVVLGQFAAWPLALKWGQVLKEAEAHWLLPSAAWLAPGGSRTV